MIQVYFPPFWKTIIPHAPPSFCHLFVFFYLLLLLFSCIMSHTNMIATNNTPDTIQVATCLAGLSLVYPLFYPIRGECFHSPTKKLWPRYQWRYHLVPPRMSMTSRQWGTVMMGVLFVTVICPSMSNFALMIRNIPIGKGAATSSLQSLP